MIVKYLPREKTRSAAVPVYLDHYLFTEHITEVYHLPDHYSGMGILSVLSGNARCFINGRSLSLDQDSFLIVNRGSTLAIDITYLPTVPVLIFFNTMLTEIIAGSPLFKENEETIVPDDFSLIEHIHYIGATLKEHLHLLIDLGNSCSSFHALKADMVLRAILDHLIHKNHAAIQSSSLLPVVKTSTRIDLYKRLAMARDWMDKHYATTFSLKQAADISMLNMEHFLRMFRQAFSETPHQYLTSVRIKKAQQLLINTEDPVSVVCEQIGFESLSSFSSLFKQRTGLAPAKFRKQNIRIS